MTTFAGGLSHTGAALWGWNDAWQVKLDALLQSATLRGDKWPTRAWCVGRIYTEHRGEFWVISGSTQVRTKAAGSMLRAIRQGKTTRPVVGDWVVFERKIQGDLALVHAFLPRVSYLCRRTFDRRPLEQGLVANVDEVWIVVPVDVPIDVSRISRYAQLVRDAQGPQAVTPVVVRTKCDHPALLSEDFETLRSAFADIEIVSVSALSGLGMQVLRERLSHPITVANIGDSGAGKSTLVNALLDADVRATGAVGATQLGRHVSTNREILVTREGALIVDTPGLRDLGMTASSETVPSRLQHKRGAITRHAGGHRPRADKAIRRRAHDE